MAAKGHALLNRIENITTDEERSELKVITGRLVFLELFLFKSWKFTIFYSYYHTTVRRRWSQPSANSGWNFWRIPLPSASLKKFWWEKIRIFCQRNSWKISKKFQNHLVPQSEWLKNSWFRWLLLFFLGLWVWIPGPWIVNLVSILFSDWSMLHLYYQFVQLVYRVTPEATVMQWPFLAPKNSWVPKNGQTCCTLPNWFLEFATTSTGWPMFSVSFLAAIQCGPVGNLACVCPVSFCKQFLVQTTGLWWLLFIFAW